METVKSIIFHIVSAAIIGGAVLAVFPQGQMKKALKAAVLAFVLACAVSSVSGVSGSGEINLDFSSEEELSSALLDRSVSAVRDEIEKDTAALLKGEGLAVYEVSADVTADENGAVYLTKITVFPRDDSEESREKIKTIICENYGITPQIGE